MQLYSQKLHENLKKIGSEVFKFYLAQHLPSYRTEQLVCHKILQTAELFHPAVFRMSSKLAPALAAERETARVLGQ